MLYYLIEWLEATYQPPGFQVFRFITVRASLSAMTALFIALVLGRYIINWLSRKQLGERVREGEQAGAVSHAHKAGTPTMGGIIILLAVLGATLLWGAIAETYVWLVVLATAWMGAFGFADDYIKTVKKNKEGLKPRYKVIGQTIIGVIVGGVLYFWPAFESYHTLTYLPFVPGKVFDYYFFEGWFGSFDLGWLIYIPVVVFIMTAVSNAVNLTDGLDGLTTGVTMIVALGLVALAYISGNSNLAEFLDVLYLPGTGELTIFAAALAAACVGFLWYNGYPATVFMGDTGSLAIGAAIGALTLMVRKELLIPLLCAIFFVEALSVILQTAYFKYTKRKTGVGKRIFKMAPLHHHFELIGWSEPKVITRFVIAAIIFALFSLTTLKLR